MRYKRRMRITNRLLERGFDFSVSQIKRWALLILGIDQEVVKGGAVQRGYTEIEALWIFLMGLLVRDYHMKLNMAKSHVLQIWRILDKEGLLPDFGLKENIPPFELVIHDLPNPFYDLKKIITREQIGDSDWTKGGEEIWVEKYSIKKIPVTAKEDLGPLYVIPLSHYLEHFRRVLITLL
jgi:hypothetical protein